MLDNCSISHKGGVVLWSRSFTPAASTLASSGASPVNSLIREALIEGRHVEEKYEKDGYAIKWTFVNDLELIFVVAYQRILQLTYVEELLTVLKTLFIKLFEPFLRTFVASLHAVGSTAVTPVSNITWDFAKAFEGWDKVFDKVLRGLEDKASQERRLRYRSSARIVETASTPPSDDSLTQPTVSSIETRDAQEIAKNVEALRNRLKGKGVKGKKGGKGAKNALSSGMSGSEDSETVTKRNKPAKVMRKWGDSAVSESDMASLDFSFDKPLDPDDKNELNPRLLDDLVDKQSMGVHKNGLYEVKDWEYGPRGTTATNVGEEGELDDIISRALNASGNSPAPAPSTSIGGTLGSLFSRLTGSKILTEEDLAPVLSGMKEHLMKKNVAKEIADKICDGVGQGLVGKKVGGFNSVKSEVRNSLSDAITRILTPKTSTDVLLSIRNKLNSSVIASSNTTGATPAKRVPYSITFVGVNGVGKSTNLSKVCFWLLQNNLKVLIAACDTFRSGAVEQLRVHVRNLSLLAGQPGSGKGQVELYERGYGKDAAGIAKDAIAHARDKNFDVVLIDTAGRMQDNEPLMRALAKLVSTNNPDKIIFVGEALVGNEAVDQLSKFDRALRDFSAASSSSIGAARGIDGMLVTKWDTVDDKVGAALSMTYVTGQPILFVGCGQTYTDLRQLKVEHVVQALLSD